MVEDVSPKQAWAALESDPSAVLLDVRTDIEWNGVGVPNLEGVGKEPIFVPWQTPPAMQVNPGFVEAARAGLAPDQPLFFICRSGVRSAAAAEAMRDAGFSRVFNVAGGFEGPPDASGQRGTVAGWQADGLPWRRG